MSECVFCRIARKEVPAVVLWEDDEVMAFLDRSPIRRAHTQVVPKEHVETFELLPQRLAAKLLALGQEIAKRMKTVYGVERVAFLFTGGDVPHAHAHVVPMHEETDITSARYLKTTSDLTWTAEHLLEDGQTLEDVRRELALPPHMGEALRVPSPGPPG